MVLLADSLETIGAIVLMAALFPLQRLICLLPQGRLRSHWRVLGALTLLFIVGYVAYAARNWNDPDLIVSVVFFFGAFYVFHVSYLALQTTTQLQRMAFLEEENITDPLIGIYNRRHLDRRLHEEVVRSQRNHRPLSVLLLDIDHFKRINDNYGHQAGDLVLIRLARLIEGSIRATDITARYGGEEIVVIAPDTPPTVAARLSERLRTVVEQTVFIPRHDDPAAKEVRITVSIGVATTGPGLADVETLLRATDEALYCAKRAGRNCVSTARPNAA